MNFKTLLEVTEYDIKQLSARYGIPLRTLYNWQTGIRKPPAYIITMIFDIYLLEGGFKDGKTKQGLDEGISADGKGVSKVSKKS